LKLLQSESRMRQSQGPGENPWGKNVTTQGKKVREAHRVANPNSTSDPSLKWECEKKLKRTDLTRK